MEQESAQKVRTPVQERSKIKKENIAEAARKLFSTKGYTGTNSKEIAREAGVSTGTFYAYYPDKSALFLEITKTYYQEIFSRIHTLIDRDKMKEYKRQELLTTIIQALYHSHDIEPELHREISIMLLKGQNQSASQDQDQILYRKVLEQVLILDQTVQSWLEDLLKLWFPEKTEEDIRVMAVLLYRVSEEIIHRMKQFPETMEPKEKILKELTRMIYIYLQKEES